MTKPVDILGGLKAVLGVVETLTPIAKLVGGPAIDNLADLAATGAAIGRNALTRAQEAKDIMSESDQAEAVKIIDRLAAINDGIAAEIAAS